MILLVILSFCLWCGLLVFHGRFWRADQVLRSSPSPDNWPSVAIVIPARDEAPTIGPVVAAHCHSTYPGALRITVVDDGSTDDTGQIASDASAGDERFQLHHAPPLPDRWTGKLWALQSGLTASIDESNPPDYVMLTDADIVQGPDLLTRLVARAEHGGLALNSVMAELDHRGFWGKLLIPAFIFFFQKLYPFPLVNDLARSTAGAAGGVMLIRYRDLISIGGIASIREALIDDCSLASRLKSGPPARPIELVLSQGANDAVSLRDNRSFESIRTMIARTAFTQLNHSALYLIGTVVGMVLIYLAGPLALVMGAIQNSLWLTVFGGLCWGAMMLAYLPTLRRYSVPAWWSVALPLAATFYTAFTIDSAVQHWRGKGGQWKGRTYSAK